MAGLACGTSSQRALVAANFDAALAASAWPIRGRNSPATSACTSSDSAALHTPSRWHLVLIDDLARPCPDRPPRSTYTWQLPVKCLMTGIFASAATRRISPSPPRGMARSIYSGSRQKLADGGAIGGADQLHGVGRQADFAGGLGQQIDDRLIRMGRFLAAAEDHGVAALHADGRGVGRHVRPRFVDEEHHAQRHADLRTSKPLGRIDDSITSPIGSRSAATSSSAGHRLDALWESAAADRSGLPKGRS